MNRPLTCEGVDAWNGTCYVSLTAHAVPATRLVMLKTSVGGTTLLLTKDAAIALAHHLLTEAEA